MSRVCTLQNAKYEYTFSSLLINCNYNHMNIQGKSGDKRRSRFEFILMKKLGHHAYDYSDYLID